MPDKLKEVICCNEPVSIVRNAEHPDNKELVGIGIWCEDCGLRSFHEKEETAIEMIKDAITAKEKKELEGKKGGRKGRFSGYVKIIWRTQRRF